MVGSKALGLAVAFALCQFGAGAFAGQVWMSDASGYLNGTDGSGGAFMVNQISGDNGQMGGPGGTSSSFATFCLERNETITLRSSQQSSNTYYTVLSASAKNGGISGGNPDPLSSATAKLFRAFRDGVDFGGTIGVISTSQESSALQYAIWRLEGEVDSNYNSLGSSTTRSKATELYNYATAGSPSGNYGVNVLQLWDSYNPSTGVYSGARQDMLTIVAVPTPTASVAGMTLLGCIAGAGYFRRRGRSELL